MSRSDRPSSCSHRCAGSHQSQAHPSTSLLGRSPQFTSPSPQDSFLPSEPSFPAALRSCDSASQLASPPRASASELDITYRQVWQPCAVSELGAGAGADAPQDPGD